MMSAKKSDGQKRAAWGIQIMDLGALFPGTFPPVALNFTSQV
jgi:hypothetical protein